jgi:anti-sigma B factor antagonist
MSTALAKMTVWAAEDFACIKIAGRANLNSSIDFKAVMNELRDRGYGRLILELSECSLMDSTFLGVLSGFGLKMGGENGGKPIELLNPNARVSGLLESLGVLHLFHVGQGKVSPPPGTHSQDHTPVNTSKAELTDTCLEAHQTLMEIEPGNVPRFKDVAQFMAENARRNRAG